MVPDPLERCRSGLSGPKPLLQLDFQLVPQQVVLGLSVQPPKPCKAAQLADYAYSVTLPSKQRHWNNKPQTSGVDDYKYIFAFQNGIVWEVFVSLWRGEQSRFALSSTEILRMP